MCDTASHSDLKIIIAFVPAPLMTLSIPINDTVDDTDHTDILQLHPREDKDDNASRESALTLHCTPLHHMQTVERPQT